MDGLDIIFQGALEEYVLDSEKVDYEDPGKHAQMGLVASDIEIQGLENGCTWMDQKRS